MTEQGTDVEVTRGRALSAMQVPPSLQAAGVQVYEDPGTGYRAVVIPPEIRQRVNVLMPVTSFAQSDPNFTPGVRLVQLDPNVHAYKQQGKLAPSKQGLEVLAQCAGILYSRADRIPRAELFDGQRYAYKGVIGIRRSDGTVEEISREYAWNEDAERMDIEEAVRKSAREHSDWSQWKVNGQKPTPEQLAVLIDEEVRKRWVKELKDGAAKAESKAILRAIRAALQIPHTFSPQEFARPFIVVGYSFTPNYDDAETKRLLVEHGLSASNSLYGRGRSDHRVLEPADVPDTVLADDPMRADLRPGRDAAIGAEAEDERTASREAVTEEQEFSGSEPGENEGGEADQSELVAAAALVLPDAFKKYAGRSIREVYETDGNYVRWLASDAVRNQQVHDAAALFLAAAEGGVS